MSNIFSFSGRARRTEYWITGIVVSILSYFLEAVSQNTDSGGSAFLILIAAALLIWVSLAVGARRCHDLGHNGFWQLIPFYPIWLAFVKGQSGPNEYGENPKGE